MPVILEAKDFEQWEKGSVEEAAALMKPAAEDVWQRWPVSKRANNSRAPDDDGSLIAIDGTVATSDEVMAAAMALGRELGQFDSNEFPQSIRLSINVGFRHKRPGAGVASIVPRPSGSYCGAASLRQKGIVRLVRVG